MAGARIASKCLGVGLGMKRSRLGLVLRRLGCYIPGLPDYLACANIEADGSGVAVSQLGHRNGVPGMESADVDG